MKEDVHDEVMDDFFIICTFIEYRECEHRT